MPSNHLILCHPLLLLSSIFPSIRVFSNESALRIRWPKYWSFSFNISPSNEHPGLVSSRMDWLDLLAVRGTLKSLLQHHSSKASILWHSAFFIVQLSHPYIRSDQSLSRVRLFATPWIAARQASLSITNSQSSPRLKSIESVMPSSYLILCRPLLLLPPIPPSIRVFSNESTLPYMTTGKTIALTRQTFVGKVMSLLLNMLSRLVITFLPKSKHLLISWLQSPSTVIWSHQK